MYIAFTQSIDVLTTILKHGYIVSHGGCLQSVSTGYSDRISGQRFHGTLDQTKSVYQFSNTNQNADIVLSSPDRYSSCFKTSLHRCKIIWRRSSLDLVSSTSIRLVDTLLILSQQTLWSSNCLCRKCSRHWKQKPAEGSYNQIILK